MPNCVLKLEKKSFNMEVNMYLNKKNKIKLSITYYLPGCCISSEKRKRILKPRIDFVKC